MRPRLSPFILACAAKCVGCRACELACAAAHVPGGFTVGSLRGSLVPRLYLTRTDTVRVPIGCRHCEEAPCAAVCPNAAIQRTEDGVFVDAIRCVGCKTCMTACPVGAMEMAPVCRDGKPVMRRTLDPTVPGGLRLEPALLASKCDLCRERPQGPACVAACPNDALTLVDPTKMKKCRNLEAALALAGAGARAGEELS